MLKKIISVTLILTIMCSLIPAYAQESAGTLLLTQRFGSFAENASSVKGIRFASGVDTRVVSEDGNKVLVSRAFGEGVKLVADNYPEPTMDKTVFSAKLKFDGEKTSGKLFNAIYPSQELALLSIGDDGLIKLADGKKISGTPRGRYMRYSIVVNWKKGTLDVWLDQKCVVSNWIMTQTAKKAPSSMSWGIQNPVSGESQIFIDDIYIYDGDKLPWQVSLPADGTNNEVLEYIPTTELAPRELLKSVEFENNSISGITINAKDEQGSFKAEIDEDTGAGVLRMYSGPENTGGCYADINDGKIPSISRYVFDTRIKINELSGGSKFPLLDGKNSAGTWRAGYTISNGSLVSRTDNAKVGSYSVGKWVRFTFAFDITSGKATVYTDGELTGSHMISDTHYPTFFRYDVTSPQGGTFDVSVDYIRIYTGAKPCDLSYFQTEDGDEVQSGEDVSISDVSVMDPADKLAKALDGKLMFMTTNDTMYYNGEKQSYINENYKPANINGSLMIPQNLLSMVTGKSVNYDASTGSVEFDGAAMNVGSTSYVKNGKTQTLSAAPLVTNGILYLPLRSVFEQIEGKVVTWDHRGLAIVADTAVHVSRYHYMDILKNNQWNESELLYRYMQFDFDSASQMRRTLISKWPNKQHPRVYYTMDDIDYILNKVASGDAEWNKAYNMAINKGNSHLTKDYDSYYHPEQSTRQNAAVQSQAIMEEIALAYLLTGEEKYAKKGVEMFSAMIDWDTLDYATAELTSGHWMALVGIGYDVFYNYLSATEDGRQLLKKARDVVLKLAYEPHIESYSGMTSQPRYVALLEDNFIGVIGGGLMTLLCAMADEEELKLQTDYLFENNLRTLATCVSAFSPDGAWYEGMSYTTYCLGNFSRALTAMYNCFGNFYGFDTAAGFNQAGYSYTYLQSTNACFAFSDSGSSYSNTSVREKWGYYFNDPIQAQMGRRQKLMAVGTYDLESLMFYYKTIERYGVPDISNQPLDKYFYSIESGTFSSSLDVEGPAFVGFHAGPTGIYHDMLDLGAFTFHSNDVVWACDLGPDSYNLPNYFSSYKYYRKRSEGENCLVINPQNLLDESGNEYHGQTKGVESLIARMDMNKPKGAFLAYDLTEGYKRDATKYIRGYYFGDNRNTLTVQYEVTLKGESELYWFMHTQHNIEIISNNQARITTSGGKTLIADVYCNVEGYKLQVMDAVPLPTSPQDASQNKNEGITKLAVHIPSASGNVNIAVKLSPENGEYEYSGLLFTPIDSWTVEDGPVPQKASLLSLSINGVPYDGVINGMRTVDIEFPFGTTQVPFVEATADKGSIISLSQPDSPNGQATIVIDGDNLIKQTVVVKFRVSAERDINVTDALQEVMPVEGVKGTLILPVNGSGQSIPEAANGPANLIDGDFETRYAQDGAGVWFEIDLGEAMDISGVAVAFYTGHTRYQYYEIMYSEDGVNFTRVWEGSSLGTTSEYESLAIPGRVRYIRLIGNKNSTSVWNSVSELRAYK
ncbi:MAG: discoidin domain-containing protein [Clostridia bacterium]|nr:discoidin domain-containing protein [Clostridia bacterium]